MMFSAHSKLLTATFPANRCGSLVRIARHCTAAGLSPRRSVVQIVPGKVRTIFSAAFSKVIRAHKHCDKKLFGIYSLKLTIFSVVLAMEEKDQQYYVEPQTAFDGRSTALQVLDGQDLKGRVAIVTGANTGIGFETARALALHGCTVIFACRNLDNAEAAVEKIKREKANVDCHVIHLDLQSLESVKKFVSEFQENHESLDMLILNAGVLGQPFYLTPDGYESTFQVNHLSQFYLTMLLEPLLSGDKEKDARVVILASGSHRKASLSEETLSETLLSPKAAPWWRRDLNAYELSKLCNVLTASELARRWKDKNISVFSLHPGSMISSDIGRHWWLYRLSIAVVKPFTKSLEQGASTSVYCATRLPARYSGSYLKDCQITEPSKSAQDEGLANRLVDISFKMVTDVLGPDAFKSS